jgi:hypothetical protein
MDLVIHKQVKASFICRFILFIFSVWVSKAGAVGGWLWRRKLHFSSAERGSQHLYICLWLLTERCGLFQGITCFFAT